MLQWAHSGLVPSYGRRLVGWTAAFTAVATVVAACSGGGGGDSRPTIPIMPDNPGTIAGAAERPAVEPGNYVRERIEPGDTDVFRVRVTEPGTLSLGLSRAGIRVKVFTRDGTELPTRSGSDGPRVWISPELAGGGGEVFVEVTPAASTTAPGEYTVSVRHTAFRPDNPGTIAGAAERPAVEPGNDVRERIEPGDTDVFRVRVTEPGTLSLGLSRAGIRVKVFTRDGTELPTRSGSDGPRVWISPELAGGGGEVFVEVTPAASTTAPGDYRVSVRHTGQTGTTTPMMTPSREG